MTLWQRPEVAGFALRRVARAARTVPDTVLTAVASEDELAAIAVKEGWGVVRAENQPLGAKHNAGLAALAAAGAVDVVVVVGSDNWICDALLPKYHELFKAGVQFAGPLDVYNVCTYDPRAAHFRGYAGPREGETLGVARGVHRSILDSCAWTLWDPAARSSLDASMRRRVDLSAVRAHRFTLAELGVSVLGIKSRVNMTHFDAMLDYPTTIEVDKASALATFPAEEVDALLAYQEERPPPLPLRQRRRNRRPHPHARGRVVRRGGGQGGRSEE